MILLDVVPPAVLNPIGIAVAIGFFFILLLAAFVAFKMMKRTLKMAVRMVIVAAILVIAMIGSIALFFGLGTSKPKYPGPARAPVNSSR